MTKDEVVRAYLLLKKLNEIEAQRPDLAAQKRAGAWGVIEGGRDDKTAKLLLRFETDAEVTRFRDFWGTILDARQTEARRELDALGVEAGG
jgi:hypothetical protein